MTQTMTRADELERGILEECHEQEHCCFVKYGNMPELFSIISIHFGCWTPHILQISID